jgi:hypothetical protein
MVPGSTASITELKEEATFSQLSMNNDQLTIGPLLITHY